MTAAEQPAGEVTLVFSDIEGSTRLLEELGTDAYRTALAEHRRIVRDACARYRGYEVDYEGDAFFYAFPSASDAVSAVSAAMAGLDEGPIRIRVGIHTGTPALDPPKYVGLDVHFAARVMSSAHGGQVVCSASTVELISARGSEPRALPLLALGEHRLKDIPEPVPLYQLGEGSFPPLKTISNTNLPRPASSFLGRAAELQEVLSRVEAGARLLTLTGPGGTGKTRLALEAATALVPAYKAGVFWVGLASLKDAALVVETIAQTLGAKDGLAEHIGERELCLLLDNLEQVVECAPELSGLLSACPKLTLLVTSRELLRISGEVEYPVPPLAEAEAVELFCARSGLEPKAEIAELCARLDSLPLAVELAAARTKALSPAQILARLGSRLDLLKGGRDADPRQATLRATIAWSYELLAPAEQLLFARLSVFAGGCTLEAAEEVAGADLDTLQSLLEKSLLRRTDSELGPRYWMLETIREYAGERLEQLGDAEEMKRRHAECFLTLAEEHEPAPMAVLKESSSARLLAEIDNLRGAIELFSTLPEPSGELRLVGTLFRFWEASGLVGEGERVAERALGRPEEASDPRLRLKVLYAASLCTTTRGDWRTGTKYNEDRLRIARTLGDEPMAAVALNDLGLAHTVLGDSESGRAYLDESRALAARIGESRIVASVTNNLSDAALARGDYLEARALAEEAIALTAPDDAWRINPEANLAFALLGLGEAERAAKWFRDTIDVVGRVFGPMHVGYSLDGLAGAVAECGEFVRAARLSGAARAIRDRGGFEFSGYERQLAQQTERIVRDALGDERWEFECTQGAKMTLDEAVEYAREDPDAWRTSTVAGAQEP